ncbi:putative disease resistance protein RPM1-like [Forsythia ovata]|uniref:Disease resistance protein RPM1-like n=1 Tax=Forsythia ovata TaxID=205694 RepID=A0ABD1U709_9LAMI
MEVANKCIQWVKITLRKPFPFLDPPPPPPDPELAASEDGNPKPSPPQAQLLDLSIPLISFCLASATSIALLFRQIHGETLPPSMQFFYLALVIAFSSAMVAKFISPKFPYAAKMLELAAIFCVATEYSYLPFDYTLGFKPPVGMGALTSLHQLTFVEATPGSGIVLELGKMKELRREDGRATCSSIEKAPQSSHIEHNRNSDI